MMKSQKDRGNQLFKNGKYSEAIAQYKGYLEQPHDDNRNAFFNLSLCYSKLGRHKESVQAAEKALILDPNYAKCYYRLALQNQEIENREYQVFINASTFLKLAPKQQTAERQQMNKLQNSCKSKLQLTKKHEKVNNLEEIMSETQKLVPPKQLRIEVDKEITEWITEWNENTQNDEAKLLEIRYIMEQIDYDYGLNVAYFYLNQIKSKQQKAKVQKQIDSIRAELNRQKPFNVKDLEIEDELLQGQGGSGEKKSSSEDDQNLFETDEKAQNKQQPRTFNAHSKLQIKNSAKPESTVATSSTKQEKVSTSTGNTITPPTSDNQNSENQTKKTSKQRIQQLFRNKQKLQEHIGEKDITMNLKTDGQSKPAEKPTPQLDQKGSKAAKPANSNSKPQGSCGCSHEHDQDEHQQQDPIARRNNLIEQIKSLVPPKPQQPQIQHKEPSSFDIQQVYNQFCGGLANQKNKFAATFKCVLRILQSPKIPALIKGSLLVLLKKRIKNFVVIMRSNSQNEQKILYSLLQKQGIEQYAIDITPLFYTP